jgi:Carboxypeptidase regulatory-like domain
MYLKIALLFVMGLASLHAAAQEKRTTHLRGTVTDSFGSVIDNAHITAKSKEGKVVGFVSNRDGIYEADLNPGIYSISFKRKPFKDFVIEEFQIGRSGKMSLDVSLICDSCEEANVRK